MIKLIDLSKTYINQANPAGGFCLGEINIEFKDTGFCAIVGKSGSGKTTLLNVMSGLDNADNGRIIVDDSVVGEDIDADTYRRKYVSFVFQRNNLLKNVNVYKNAAMPLAVNGLEIDKHIIASAVDRVGISDLIHKKVKHLSAGQEQRVAIARALVKNTPIIFADEPTANLDDKNADAVFKLLREIAKDKLVVMVSHDADRCYEYVDRIIELEDGVIIKDVMRSKNSADNLIKLNNRGEIDNNTIKQINENKNKLLVVDNYSFFENNENKKVSHEKTIKNQHEKSKSLKTKRLFSLAFSSMNISKLKSAILTVVCAIVIALVGLGITIVDYDKGVGMAKSFMNDPLESIVVTQGVVDVYGNISGFGGSLKKESYEYLKSNHDNKIIPIKNVSGLNIETSYLESESVTPKGIMGVMEIEENDIKNLGFKLMNFPYVDVNNPEMNSRFPSTGRPVPISAENNATVNEVVITDYMALILYKEYFGFDINNLPESTDLNKSDLQFFLDSGFEREFMKFEVLFLMPNRIRIVGILDTGYKQKYLDIIEGNYTLTDTLYKQFVVDVAGIHSMAYSSEGFAETCYTNNFEGEFHYITGATNIYAQYEKENAISFIAGHSGELGDNEVLLDIQAFAKCVGQPFDSSSTVPYKFKDSYDNIDFSNLKIVGTVDTRGKQLFSSSGIVCAQSLFGMIGEKNAYTIGARINIDDDTDVEAMFSYLSDANIIPIIINYSTILNINATISNLSPIFTPILIVLIVVALIMLSVFLSYKITSKKYYNGLYRSFGMKNSDSLKYLALECVMYILATIVLACLILFLVVNIANSLLLGVSGAYNPLYFVGIELFYHSLLPYTVILLGVPLVSAIIMTYPLISISRINPIDSIRRAD